MGSRDHSSCKTHELKAKRPLREGVFLLQYFKSETAGMIKRKIYGGWVTHMNSENVIYSEKL